jgi:hypothetical protein
MSMQAQKVSRGIAVLIHNLGARWGVGGQSHGMAILPQGKSPVHIIEGAEWALESVWMGMEERKSLFSHLGSSPRLSSL